jgi:hypothetical protein
MQDSEFLRFEYRNIDTLLNSLKDAKLRLGSSGTAADPEAIMCRIHLCNVLLSEISGLRNYLGRSLKKRKPAPSSAPQQGSFVN